MGMRPRSHEGTGRLLKILPLAAVFLACSSVLPGQTFTISTLAGDGTNGFVGDGGPANSAQLSEPYSVAVDSAGNLYIAEFGNNTIRLVTGGVITTVAGNETAGFTGDNGVATAAELSGPHGVAVDSAGNLYIADSANNVVRKVSSGVITTIAGNVTPGFSGDNGPATSAQLNFPVSVALDSAGNLYIADELNHRVRKVSTNGTITTVAGNGNFGFSGDNGPATSAQLTSPTGVAVDSAGNLYIADGSARVRKVSNGVITTVAGNGTQGFGGDNGPAASAELSVPTGLALDAAGNLYIADQDNNRVREVSNGVIFTIAGNGIHGYLGDNGPATSAALSSPTGVAVDTAGNVYIADSNNSVIRLLTPTNPLAPTIIDPEFLLSATVGVPYNPVQFTAIGGKGPYTWTATGLPNGATLMLSPAGVLSGTPTVAATFNIQITVTDSSQPPLSASRTYPLTILGITQTVMLSASSVNSPTDQPLLSLALDIAPTDQASGTLSLFFTPDPSVSNVSSTYRDPAASFPSPPGFTTSPDGSTETLQFMIPEGCTAIPTECRATPGLVWPTQFSQGTVAGTLVIEMTSFVQDGTSLLPLQAPAVAITIPPSAPVITSVQLTNITSTGFIVKVEGYSTIREVQNGTFAFTAAAGAQLQATQVTIPFNGMDQSQWFGTTASLASGGTFSLQVPFAYSGNPAALGTATVTLTNSRGTSAPVTGGP